MATKSIASLALNILLFTMLSGCGTCGNPFPTPTLTPTSTPTPTPSLSPMPTPPTIACPDPMQTPTPTPALTPTPIETPTPTPSPMPMPPKGSCPNDPCTKPLTPTPTPTPPPTALPPTVICPPTQTPMPMPMPTPTPTPMPSTVTCSKDTLKLGVCGNLLGGLVGVILGSPSAKPCCTLLEGLADLEAAVCLCTAIKANVLGINLNVPVSLGLLLNACDKKVPSGFSCA